MKRPRKLGTDRARRFCSALGILSELRPQRWRMLDSVAKAAGLSWEDAETAANEAAANGWALVEGRHSVCLTEEGRGPLPRRLPRRRRGFAATSPTIFSFYAPTQTQVCTSDLIFTGGLGPDVGL